jgi:serine/threonine protein phosphatase PrpC
VDIANKRGGDDNITVIVVKVIKTGKKGKHRIVKLFSRIAGGLSNISLIKIFKK